uniref:Peptidase M12B propeptide domain-containing protein n=1 Tax=Zonotrichia albicollis TaxID=44394 RepID=A0A8D2MSF6_ZONAL
MLQPSRIVGDRACAHKEFLSSLDHYEIAFPIQLKPRPRRSLPYEPSEQQVFYKVSAHHTQFLLNLTLHSNLLAEHFTVEYWKRDGMDWQHDFHEDCHYAGHLQDQYLSSKVAISNCNGLVSLPWLGLMGAVPAALVVQKVDLCGGKRLGYKMLIVREKNPEIIGFSI